MACAPTDASTAERAALIEAAQRAGAAAVQLIPEPLAAAVGAGLDISLPYAQMLIDIGDGVTDIAVIRSGSLIASEAVRIACSNLHAAVRRMVKAHHDVVLDETEAERLTRELGAAIVSQRESALAVSGAVSGRAARGVKKISVTSGEVNGAISPLVNVIMETARDAVRSLEPQVAAEVIESGICLTGGGANLRAIAERLADETGLVVRRAGDPMHAVIRGASRMLDLSVRTNLRGR